MSMLEKLLIALLLLFILAPVFIFIAARVMTYGAALGLDDAARRQTRQQRKPKRQPTKEHN